MNKHILLASIASISVAIAVPVFADNLNPQPEPPGVHAKVNNMMGGAMAGGAMTTSNKLPPGPCAPAHAGAMMSGNSMSNSAALHCRKAGGDPMMGSQPMNPGVTHGFNPQPDPPGKTNNMMGGATH